MFCLHFDNKSVEQNCFLLNLPVELCFLSIPLQPFARIRRSRSVAGRALIPAGRALITAGRALILAGRALRATGRALLFAIRALIAAGRALMPLRQSPPVEL